MNIESKQSLELLEKLITEELDEKAYTVLVQLGPFRLLDFGADSVYDFMIYYEPRDVKINIIVKEQIGAGILRGIGEALKYRNETAQDGCEEYLIFVYGELVGGEAEHLETAHITLFSPGDNISHTLQSVAGEIRRIAES